VAHHFEMVATAYDFFQILHLAVLEIFRLAAAVMVAGVYLIYVSYKKAPRYDASGRRPATIFFCYPVSARQRIESLSRMP
jgi:hypothetical protein